MYQLKYALSAQAHVQPANSILQHSLPNAHHAQQAQYLIRTSADNSVIRPLFMTIMWVSA